MYNGLHLVNWFFSVFTVLNHIWLDCRDLGCHVDGFIAVVAHTHVLSEGPVTGRAADVLAAAHTAAEVALRLVRPGKKVCFCLSHFILNSLVFASLWFVQIFMIVMKK